jgi:demethylmenaquinone methyltransferase/2-methoxy-6-polyprenyl-1,4-benzoquinol methylase
MGETRKLSLEEYVASPEKKQRYVNKLFDTIAGRYDFFTAAMSYGMDRGWKRRLIEMADFCGTELVLDLACGTGDITFAAGHRLNTGWAIGLDITRGMLQIAEHKRRQNAGARVSFHQADIMSLPFESETFERVTGGYALRNVPDIPGALREIFRVLKPGGRFLSLDFGHPPNRLYRHAYLWYLTAVGSAAGLAMHGDADTYRYIPESLKLYPGQRGVQNLMNDAGFVDTGFRQFGGGIMAINYGTRAEPG